MEQNTRQHITAVNALAAVFEYIVTDVRMPFDLSEFRVGKLAWLDDYIMVDVGFSDIMQQRRNDYLFCVLFC